jgi:uncharacterized protein (DUF486 family)
MLRRCGSEVLITAALVILSEVLCLAIFHTRDILYCRSHQTAHVLVRACEYAFIAQLYLLAFSSPQI